MCIRDSIHSTFNQTEARTGRLSSDNPNLQNIPIRTELGSQLRAYFIAKPGCVLVDADYSPVSYTHLDVYKRQVPVRPSWNWTAVMCMPASMRWLKSWPKWKSAGARAARLVPRPVCR